MLVHPKLCYFTSRCDKEDNMTAANCASGKDLALNIATAMFVPITKKPWALKLYWLVPARNMKLIRQSCWSSVAAVINVVWQWVGGQWELVFTLLLKSWGWLAQRKVRETIKLSKIQFNSGLSKNSSTNMNWRKYRRTQMTERQKEHMIEYCLESNQHQPQGS